MSRLANEYLTKPEIALLQIAETSYLQGMRKLEADRAQLRDMVLEAHGFKQGDRVELEETPEGTMLVPVASP
jgi:hypothetical protein